MNHFFGHLEFNQSNSSKEIIILVITNQVFLYNIK